MYLLVHGTLEFWKKDLLMPVTTNMGCDTELTAQKLHLSAPEASFEGVLILDVSLTESLWVWTYKQSSVVW